jgi:peptidyl-prolyl cis-trans isomerase C
VIKLNESRMKGAPPLEEVAGDIVAKLENDAVEQALATLLAAAEIERVDLTSIDPAVLSDLAILD